MNCWLSFLIGLVAIGTLLTGFNSAATERLDSVGLAAYVAVDAEPATGAQASKSNRPKSKPTTALSKKEVLTKSLATIKVHIGTSLIRGVHYLELGLLITCSYISDRIARLFLS